MNILHHGANGYVGHCHSCGRYHVAFGTSLFQVHDDLYDQLLSELEADLRYGGDGVDPRTKCFIHDIGDGSMKLVLNHHEVGLLRSMLADARWMQGVMEMAGNDVS